LIEQGIKLNRIIGPEIVVMGTLGRRRDRRLHQKLNILQVKILKLRCHVRLGGNWPLNDGNAEPLTN
jgi:hypothetical protein